MAGSAGDQTSVLQVLNVYVLSAKHGLYHCESPLPLLRLLEKQHTPTQQPQELLGVCPTWVTQDDSSSNATWVCLWLLCSCVEEAKNCCQARNLVKKCKLYRLPLVPNFSSGVNGPASHCPVYGEHSRYSPELRVSSEVHEVS